MPSSAVAAGRLALAMLAIGAAPGCVQEPRETNELALQGAEPNAVVVHPARVPVAGSPSADERIANLRPPPPGPIESRLLSLPAKAVREAPRLVGRPASAPSTAAVFTTPPVSSLASGRSGLDDTKPVGEPAPSSDGTRSP